MAGGLNLYGYAAGDPVSYSDPFGLFACPPDCYDASDATAVLQRLGRLAPAMDKAIKVAAAVTLAPIAIMAGTDVAAGGAALTTLNLASRAGAASGAMPVVRSALDKLNGLADKFSTTAGNIAYQALNNGQRMVDNANGGNVNAIIPRPDGARGFIRVTLDPTQSRIISAGLQSANMVSNGLADGRFTPIQ